MSKSSLEAAAEAAAKVNAMLIARGKLKLPSSHIKPKIGNTLIGRPKAAGDLITAEVDINDAPLSARDQLTRGHVQDDICKLSGASLSTRGRYMTPEERQTIATPESRPLYLNVQASNPDSIRVAVRRIQEIIDKEVVISGVAKNPTVGVVTYPASVANGSGSVYQNNHTFGSHFVQDKVFIGLEQAPPEYPVREKILGPGGSFLQHIRAETGATVHLRGRGSGYIEPTSGREAFEPLYIHVTHPKPEGLQAAKALAINLVETAHVEFAQWQQTQQQAVLQPLTSIVLPQASPVAYHQNQVVVTPTVLPGTSVVATGIQIPTSVATPGTSLTAGIPSIIQTGISTLVSPVSVVSSVPVSVQAISPAVITYPTYVANTNSILSRQTAQMLARPATPAVSILGVLPTLPTTAAYTVARTRPSYQIQPLVYAASIQSPQANNLTPLATSPVVVSIAQAQPQPTNYPITTRYTYPPPISQSRSDITGQRYYNSMSAVNPGYPANVQPSNCLQESNVNHPTEFQSRRGVGKRESGDQDRELMPPPMMTSHSVPQPKSSNHYSEVDECPPRKRLKGALGGLASMYGSDDSDEDEFVSNKR